ncbi:MAG: hypothetical protein IJH12_04710 [Clostridia bacterium]|nr:hypothetical protein [Clostridia bacterium]
MPGYIIHLAVGKEYAKNNEIKNIEEFEKGIIAPDLIDKDDKYKSHYGPNSSNPNLNKFIEKKGISTNYNEGYFIHLLTDYLFYNKFLKEWNFAIYEDYDKLNAKLIEKYNINVPSEIQKIVKYKNGELTVLNEEELYKFIACVGKISARKIVKQYNNVQEEVSNEFEI